MAKIHEYKCPCCDGALQFDLSSQNIKCPYCDSEFDVSVFEELKADADSAVKENTEWDEIDHEIWSEEESKGLNVYHCDSCGGEIVTEGTTAATACPYCSAPVIIKGHVTGGFKPEYIIPFKKTKEQAAGALTGYLKGKLFLPRSFKQLNTIEEIRGLYVPYWLFDADVDGRVVFKGETEERHRRGDDEIVITRYYNLVREGKVGFDHVPVDGSKKLADDMMESIEPFNFKEDHKEFSPLYLTGYMADMFDVDSESAKPRATERIRQGTVNQFATTIAPRYKHIRVSETALKFLRTDAHYAFYPIWIMNTSWKDKRFIFAVNADTGTIKGDLPMSKAAYWGWWFGLFAGVFGIIGGLIGINLAISINNGSDYDPIAYFLGFALALLAAILTPVIFCRHHKKKLKGFVYQNGAGNYLRSGSFGLRVNRDIFLYSKRRVIHHSSSSSSSSRKRR